MFLSSEGLAARRRCNRQARRLPYKAARYPNFTSPQIYTDETWMGSQKAFEDEDEDEREA